MLITHRTFGHRPRRCTAFRSPPGLQGRGLPAQGALRGEWRAGKPLPCNPGDRLMVDGNQLLRAFAVFSNKNSVRYFIIRIPPQIQGFFAGGKAGRGGAAAAGHAPGLEKATALVPPITQNEKPKTQNGLISRRDISGERCTPCSTLNKGPSLRMARAL